MPLKTDPYGLRQMELANSQFRGLLRKLPPLWLGRSILSRVSPSRKNLCTRAKKPVFLRNYWLPERREELADEAERSLGQLVHRAEGGHIGFIGLLGHHHCEALLGEVDVG